MVESRPRHKKLTKGVEQELHKRCQAEAKCKNRVMGGEANMQRGNFIRRTVRKREAAAKLKGVKQAVAKAPGLMIRGKVHKLSSCILSSQESEEERVAKEKELKKKKMPG